MYLKGKKHIVLLADSPLRICYLSANLVNIESTMQTQVHTPPSTIVQRVTLGIAPTI